MALEFEAVTFIGSIKLHMCRHTSCLARLDLKDRNNTSMKKRKYRPPLHNVCYKTAPNDQLIRGDPFLPSNWVNTPFSPSLLVDPSVAAHKKSIIVVEAIKELKVFLLA